MITKNPPWAKGPGVSRYSFSIKCACAVASILAMGVHPTGTGRFGHGEGHKPLRLLHEQLYRQGGDDRGIKDPVIEDGWMDETIIAESDETNVDLGLEAKDRMKVGGIPDGRATVSDGVVQISLIQITSPHHILNISCTLTISLRISVKKHFIKTEAQMASQKNYLAP